MEDVDRSRSHHPPSPMRVTSSALDPRRHWYVVSKDLCGSRIMAYLSCLLVTQGKPGSHQPRTSRKINFAKQNRHGGTSSWSGCGIYFQKWKKTHRQFIISAFTRSMAPPFTSINVVSRVAKNGVSFDSSISLLHKFLGAGKWNVSPSKACRNSGLAIIF